MNPGEFRHKTTITLFGEAQQSDYGDYAKSTEPTADRFAKVRSLPGTEVIEAETLTIQRNVEFTYRYDTITNFFDRIDTITYDSNIYKVNSIQYKGLGNQQYIIVRASAFTE